MRLSNLALIAGLLWTSCAIAQVLSPMEMNDPATRSLQQRHLRELQAISAELKDHRFPYPFYFSRKLDIDEAEQKQLDQRSIRFEFYNNQKALEITGNYYASYSDELVDADHRMRQTFVSVILPILQATVPRLWSASDFDLFAIEVSHHVRRKVMGMNSEFAENMVVVIPREQAFQLVQAHDLLDQQNVLLDAEVYHNGEPAVLWLTGEKPMMLEARAGQSQAPPPTLASSHSTHGGLRAPGSALPPLPRASVPPELVAEPLHESSPDGLKELQAKYQEQIEKLTKEQDKEAHFVPYAPPAFIAFKRGTYLQLALTTTLDAGVSDSQYRLAALAFDRHIAHLVRPVLAYFKDDGGFDGIDFSTTIKIAADNDNGHSLAVEFILPLSALHCFQQYDCTGQQLLNTGIVLINGERAGLELQTAEAK
jgi:hypothetical protein